MDTLTELIESQGFISLLKLVPDVTKWLEFKIPTLMEIDVPTLSIDKHKELVDKLKKKDIAAPILETIITSWVKLERPIVKLA